MEGGEGCLGMSQGFVQEEFFQRGDNVSWGNLEKGNETSGKRLRAVSGEDFPGGE